MKLELKITPNDALCFGRGKTTDAGESSFGSDMFPPYPTVILGAMRGAFLSQNSDYIPSANTKDDPTKGYELSFYGMILDGKIHLPAPADTFIIGKDEAKKTEKLKLLELKENDGLSSLPRDPYRYCLWTDQGDKDTNPSGLWLDTEILENYLRGSYANLRAVRLSDYALRETRVGIARDDSRHAAADSMLYNSAMTRLENAEFAVDLECESPTAKAFLEKSGIIRLGKHGKTARYGQRAFTVHINGQIGENGLFKLYFATPAVFEQGSDPGWPMGLALPNARLVAAAIDGYEIIGGYDIKANVPKKAKRAVKAGSVFYYRLEENTQENRDKIYESLHGKRIPTCDPHVGTEYHNAGLGLCYVGSVNVGATVLGRQ